MQMINALVKSALALGYMLFLISAPSVFRGRGQLTCPLTRPSLYSRFGLLCWTPIGPMLPIWVNWVTLYRPRYYCYIAH